MLGNGFQEAIAIPVAGHDKFPYRADVDTRLTQFDRAKANAQHAAMAVTQP